MQVVEPAGCCDRHLGSMPPCDKPAQRLKRLPNTGVDFYRALNRLGNLWLFTDSEQHGGLTNGPYRLDLVNFGLRPRHICLVNLTNIAGECGGG